jgi:hypothetical protein
MESWRRSGDFKTRERRAKRATERRAQLQTQRLKALTHDAIDRFEEVLKAEREKADRDFDDLPPEAEAGFERHYRSLGATNFGTAASRDSSTSERENTYDRLQRSHSDTAVRALPPVDHDPCMMRPPSPLGLYDYGRLSVKPRSTFAQHKQKSGESTRARHRQVSPGFYFPGSQFKQGPYGFSMLDPCLMAPRSWSTSQPTPVRWENDPADIRPLSTEDLGHKRNFIAKPVTSDIVRTTRCHAKRAQLSFQNLDKHRQEKILEQVKFETGVFDGRWRDPVLEQKGQLPEEAPEERHEWLGNEKEDMHSTQQLGSHILFGLQNCLRTSRAKLTSLFWAEGKGHPGVLEPAEFLKGLERLGIVEEGELTLDDVVEAMTTIDPNFDGRVNLPIISRAIATATKIQSEQTKAAQQRALQYQDKISHSYSESLPVEVVKVDRESRSLFNFERSFEKFRNQQRLLLANHNELGVVDTTTTSS